MNVWRVLRMALIDLQQTLLDHLLDDLRIETVLLRESDDGGGV